MKRTCLIIALALCCVAVLSAGGCEDVSTTTIAAGAETTTTVSAETTTTAPAETTIAAPTTTAPTTTAAPKTTTTSPPKKAGPAPKEHLLKGTWEWDVDSDGMADIWYQIVDELVHYLVPENGSGFARMTGKTFATVSLSDLQAAAYTADRLATEGVDDPNVLMPGDVLGLCTSSGRYAKIEVVEFIPETIDGGMVLARYNVKLRYVLY